MEARTVENGYEAGCTGHTAPAHRAGNATSSSASSILPLITDAGQRVSQTAREREKKKTACLPLFDRALSKCSTAVVRKKSKQRLSTRLRTNNNN